MLLQTWWTTAVDQGITQPSYQQPVWASSLAGVALDMATKQVPAKGPSTPDEAEALLDRVAARLGDRGISARCDVLNVVLPRTEATPAWGTYAPERLAITVAVDQGWQLVVDQPNGSYVVQIVGLCDSTGIDAMLDVAFEVNSGDFGNVFAR